KLYTCVRLIALRADRVATYDLQPVLDRSTDNADAYTQHIGYVRRHAGEHHRAHHHAHHRHVSRLHEDRDARHLHTAAVDRRASDVAHHRQRRVDDAVRHGVRRRRTVELSVV